MSWNPAPEGRPALSPALQRWEKWKERFKSRSDDRVLVHTLQRWGKVEGATWDHQSPVRDGTGLRQSFARS